MAKKDMDTRELAAAAFEEAKSANALPSLGRETVSEMARDIAGDDELAYGAAMDTFDTQDILASRSGIVTSFAAEEDSMHSATRASMVRTLGLSPDEYARALADEKMGDTSTMLSLKEAYVFR